MGDATILLKTALCRLRDEPRSGRRVRRAPAGFVGTSPIAVFAVSGSIRLTPAGMPSSPTLAAPLSRPRGGDDTGATSESLRDLFRAAASRSAISASKPSTSVGGAAAHDQLRSRSINGDTRTTNPIRSSVSTPRSNSGISSFPSPRDVATTATRSPRPHRLRSQHRSSLARGVQAHADMALTERTVVGSYTPSLQEEAWRIERNTGPCGPRSHRCGS